MLAPAPPIEAGAAAACWSSCRRGPGRPQRPVRRGVPQGRLRPARLPLAQPAGAGHRRAGPPGADPRRGAQPQARHARRATSAPPPSRPTARWTTPGPPSTCCTALIGRLGGHRVDTLGDAIEFARAVTPAQRRKRHLAEGLPDVPGRLHLPGRRRPAALRRHVAATSPPGCAATSPPAEKRARISEMLAAAERVEAIECAHSLEAEVRELRLIAAHKPPYNRRSKYPRAGALAEADRGAVPAAVGGPAARAPDDAAYLGPVLARRRAAELAAAGRLRRGAAAPVHAPALARAAPRRPARWPSWAAARRPASTGSPRSEYARRAAAPFRSAMTGDPQPAGRRACWPGSRRSPRPAVRGGGGGPGPAGRAAAGRRADAAAGRADPDRRAGRRPAGRPRAAGRSRWSGTAGWPAPAPRRPGAHPRPTLDTGPGDRRDGAAGTRAGAVRQRPRSPSGSCPGWSDPRRGWWRCPTAGPPRRGARRASATCSPRPRRRAQLLDRTLIGK